LVVAESKQKIGSPSFSCYFSAAPSWLHHRHDLLNSPASSIDALPRPAIISSLPPVAVAPSIAIIAVALPSCLPSLSPSRRSLSPSPSHCRCAFHHRRRRAIHRHCRRHCHRRAAHCHRAFHCHCRCRCCVTVAPSVAVVLPSHRPSSLPSRRRRTIRCRCAIHCRCRRTAVTRLCRSRC
jgi:hypothetical protein